jgi:hypothetical protein
LPDGGQNGEIDTNRRRHRERQARCILELTGANWELASPRETPVRRDADRLTRRQGAGL